MKAHQENNDNGAQEDTTRLSTRTAAFLATEHSLRTLCHIGTLEVPVEDLNEDERKMLVDLKYNPNTYQSIRDVEKDDNDKDGGAPYNSEDDDPTLGEFITSKTVAIGICWLASCGMMCYYIMKGYYMWK